MGKRKTKKGQGSGLARYMYGSGGVRYHGIEHPDTALARNDIAMAGAMASRENLLTNVLDAGGGFLLQKGLSGLAGAAIPGMAFGGMVPGQVPVEVEGGEIGETPGGQMLGIEGPSHEEGGVPALLPEATRIYSGRVKIDGVTMADRKGKRKKREVTLERLMEKASGDALLRNALGRTREANEKEEGMDLALQDLVGRITAPQPPARPPVPMLPPAHGMGGSGTPLPKSMLPSMEGFGDGGGDLPEPMSGVGEYATGPGGYATGTGPLGLPMAGVGYDNALLGGMPEVLATRNYVTGKPRLSSRWGNMWGGLKGAANDTLWTVGGAVDKGAQFLGLGGSNAAGVSAGDVLSLGGALYSATSPMKNTLANRAGDRPNVNYFEHYGKDGLRKLDEAKGHLAALRDSGMREAERNRLATTRSLRNSARGVNTLRALDLAANAQAGRQEDVLRDAHTRNMMGLAQQEAALMDRRDQMVMQGEQARDISDRQDRDAFYTQLARDMATKGQGIQEIGRMLNQMKQAREQVNIVNQMSKWGLQFDGNGNLVHKPTVADGLSPVAGVAPSAGTAPGAQAGGDGLPAPAPAASRNIVPQETIIPLASAGPRAMRAPTMATPSTGDWPYAAATPVLDDDLFDEPEVPVVQVKPAAAPPVRTAKASPASKPAVAAAKPTAKIATKPAAADSVGVSPVSTAPAPKPMAKAKSGKKSGTEPSVPAQPTVLDTPINTEPDKKAVGAEEEEEEKPFRPPGYFLRHDPADYVNRDGNLFRYPDPYEDYDPLGDLKKKKDTQRLRDFFGGQETLEEQKKKAQKKIEELQRYRDYLENLDPEDGPKEEAAATPEPAATAGSEEKDAIAPLDSVRSVGFGPTVEARPPVLAKNTSSVKKAVGGQASDVQRFRDYLENFDQVAYNKRKAEEEAEENRRYQDLFKESGPEETEEDRRYRELLKSLDPEEQEKEKARKKEAAFQGYQEYLESIYPKEKARKVAQEKKAAFHRYRDYLENFGSGEEKWEKALGELDEDDEEVLRYMEYLERSYSREAARRKAPKQIREGEQGYDDLFENFDQEEAPKKNIPAKPGKSTGKKDYPPLVSGDTVQRSFYSNLWSDVPRGASGTGEKKKENTGAGGNGAAKGSITLSTTTVAKKAPGNTFVKNLRGVLESAKKGLQGMREKAKKTGNGTHIRGPWGQMPTAKGSSAPAPSKAKNTVAKEPDLFREEAPVVIKPLLDGKATDSMGRDRSHPRFGLEEAEANYDSSVKNAVVNEKVRRMREAQAAALGRYPGYAYDRGFVIDQGNVIFYENILRDIDEQIAQAKEAAKEFPKSASTDGLETVTYEDRAWVTQRRLENNEIRDLQELRGMAEKELEKQVKKISKRYPQELVNGSSMGKKNFYGLLRNGNPRVPGRPVEKKPTAVAKAPKAKKEGPDLLTEFFEAPMRAMKKGIAKGFELELHLLNEAYEKKKKAGTLTNEEEAEYLRKMGRRFETMTQLRENR